MYFEGTSAQMPRNRLNKMLEKYYIPPKPKMDRLKKTKFFLQIYGGHTPRERFLFCTKLGPSVSTVSSLSKPFTKIDQIIFESSERKETRSSPQW